MRIHLVLLEVQHKEDIAAAIHRHFCYRREQSQKKIDAPYSMDGDITIDGDALNER
jgi:hypothetical protein